MCDKVTVTGKSHGAHFSIFSRPSFNKQMGEETEVKSFRTLFYFEANNSYDCFHFNHGISTNLFVKEEVNWIIAKS